jgi:hypothetical protein
MASKNQKTDLKMRTCGDGCTPVDPELEGESVRRLESEGRDGPSLLAAVLYRRGLI